MKICKAEAAVLFLHNRVNWALWHAADGTHIGAAVAGVFVNDVGLFSGVCAHGITWADRTASVAHDAEIWFNCKHGSDF